MKKITNKDYKELEMLHANLLGIILGVVDVCDKSGGFIEANNLKKVILKHMKDVGYSIENNNFWWVKQ